MNGQNIENKKLIDILFQYKNKKYGAYELRTKYNKRLLIALIGMFLSIFGSIGIVYATTAITKALAKNKTFVVKEVTLEDIDIEEPPPPPDIPPPPPKPKVEMKKFTPPKIVEDEQVDEDERPPEIEELKDVRISTVNQKGIKELDIVAPPDEVGVAEGPAVDEDKTFRKVEIEATFPGGKSAWRRYITREIERYIDDLIDDGFVGQVVVEFIVDKNGLVSHVKALNNSNTRLAEIAINSIKNGPPWTPAVQNGRSVKAYRRQPVSFVVE